MTEARMRRLWPLGPWPLVAPAIAIFMVVITGTSAMWEWPYQDWLATSSAFMLQLAVPGPIGAAVAAYYSSRITGTGGIFTSRPGGLPATRIMRRHLGLLLSWLVGAYVAGLLPLLVLGVMHADVGHPSGLVIATGILGLCSFIVLGYVTGNCIQGFVSVPVSFVVSLALVVLGTTATMTLSPVPAFAFAIGDVPAFSLLAVRLIVLCLLVLACLTLSAVAIRGSRRPPLVAVVAGCLVLLFAALVKLNPPDVRALETNAPRVCTESSRVETCAHQGHRVQLSAVAAAATPIVEAYGPSPRGRWRVLDAALAGGARPAGGALYVGVAPENDEADVVPSDLAGQLISIDACTNRYGFQLPDRVESLYTYLQAWLINGGQRPTDYAYAHFEHLDRAGMQRWLASNRKTLTTCTVDLGALPR